MSVPALTVDPEWGLDFAKLPLLLLNVGGYGLGGQKGLGTF